MASSRTAHWPSVPLFSLAAAVSLLLLSPSSARAGSPAAQSTTTGSSTAAVGNGTDGLALDAATHTLYTVDEAGSISVVDTRRCNAEGAPHAL
jgi:hypothetical protein